MTPEDKAWIRGVAFALAEIARLRMSLRWVAMMIGDVLAATDQGQNCLSMAKAHISAH